MDMEKTLEITVKLSSSGDSQTVNLPEAFHIDSEEVTLRRDGDNVVLEPVRKKSWPKNFFRDIRIKDKRFKRQPQGTTPPIREL